MRAVRSVRLVIFVAALVAGMSIGVASASAFSLSSSTSSTQAGAPTDLRFTYVATGTESLSRLDVDLPPGMMHDPSAAPTCPVADFLADRCSTSRIGQVATVINVAGVNVSVPGDIFPIADPADNSDYPLGIVLRPPLSALGLTGKIYLRDRVSFTNAGGLRHSITGALSSFSVLGLPLRSRVTQSAWTFTGRSSRANQLYNSTSCASQPLRATATFSDGRTEARTTSRALTGCDKLIAIGGADVDFDARATQPKSFAAKLGSPARAPAGVTHEYHRSAVRTDISEIGDWDQEGLLGGPTCTDQEFITNTCPIRSQIGTVSTGIEGFPGTRTGSVYNSYPRGAKPKARIHLRPGVTVDFTLDFVTDAAGRASLHIDDLPQLPVTDFKIEISAAGLKAKQKPASCTNREVRSVIFGHNGGQTNSTAKYPPVPCPPSVTVADPRDDDADGDGFADDELRAENFGVGIIVTAEGQELDTGRSRCEISSPDPAQAVRGKVKVIRDTGNGYTCEVTEAAGQVTVSFYAYTVEGHVTVLKRSYTIDSEAPVLDSAAPDPMVLDTTSIELPFEFTDDRIGHPQSDYTVECTLTDGNGFHMTTPGHKYVDTLTLRGGGTCQWDSGRRGKYSGAVTLMDNTGHVTVLKRNIIVDGEGPMITLTDRRDQDSEADGLADDELRAESFEVRFSVSDAFEVEADSVACKLINPVAMDKGLRVADTDGDGLADVCIVEGAPTGPISVEISAADWRGHVTVLKIGYTGDSEAPVVDSATPEVIDFDTEVVTFDFEFTDDTLAHPQSEFVGECELIDSARVKHAEFAQVDVDKELRVGRGLCQWDTGRFGKSEHSYEMNLRLKDKVGHVTLIKRTINVDTEGPTITLTDPRDQDSDGDGLADDELRPSSFDIPLTVADNSRRTDNKVSCNVTFTNPIGKCVPVDLDGDGAPELLRITDAPGGPLSVEVSAIDWRGHVTVLKVGFTIDIEAPVIAGGGRGFYTIPEVDDEFVVTDDTMTHPQSEYTAECRLEGDKLEGGKEGRARVIVDRDTGRSKARCTVDEVPDGDYSLTMRVRDKVGHVTLIKRTAQVDTTPPTLVVGDEECDDNNPNPDDGCSRAASFNIDVSASDAGSGLESVTCRKGKRGWFGVVKNNMRVADLDGDGAVDVCIVDDAPEGLVDFEFVARDKVGHETVVTRTFQVDAQGPTITLANPEGTDSDGDGVFDEARYVRSFDRAIVVTDHSDLDLRSVKCTVRGWDPTTKQQISAVDLDGDGLADVCRITDAPDGLHMIEISAADVHGHVTVLKLAVTVEVSPPVVTITSPAEGATIPYNGTLTVGFDVVSETAVTATCRVDTIVIAMACSSGQTFTVTGMGAGGHVLSVTVEDEHGLTTTASRAFSVASAPPPGDVCLPYEGPGGCNYPPNCQIISTQYSCVPVVCAAVYPPPPGCPGYLPPGGIITFP